VIDFRYHVVSLVAVLLALATGILVGSSLLNQSLLDSQRATISSLAQEKDGLRRDLAVAQGQVAYRDDYLASLNTTLLPSRLLGQRVVLVTLPRSDEKEVAALTKTLTEAGAQVPTRIAVTDDFFADDAKDNDDTTNKTAERDALVRRYALPDVKSKDANAQLAGAVMSKIPGRTLEAPAATLLTELDKAGFISRRSGSDRGDVAVMVAGPPSSEPTDKENHTRAGAVSLAAALDAAGRGTVVAGPVASAAGGVIAALRKSPSVSDIVSSVDTLDSPFGRVATAYALVEQIAGGAGQYGSGEAADSPLPEFRGAPTKSKK
jgi:hypothetical protein